MQTGRDDLYQLYTHLGAKLVEDISMSSTANILAAPSSRFRFLVSATQIVKLKAKWEGIDPLRSRSLKKRWVYLAMAFALVTSCVLAYQTWSSRRGSTEKFSDTPKPDVL